MQSNLLGALGINWQALLANIIAFLIILVLLSKYVYPLLTKALDKKADELAAAARLEQEAQAKLEAAQKEAHALLGHARIKADELLETTKVEADEVLADARAKAEEQAGRIVAEASKQLAKEVQVARTTLRAETAMLVAQATEAVLDEKLTSAKDEALINKQLETHS